MRCSIAPNSGRSCRSRASMRTVSPKRMKPVLAAPSRIISIARRSAMQAEPAAPPALLTVPEPSRVPARRRRVAAACAISCGKLKFISRPFGWPNQAPFQSMRSGSCTRPSCQAGPSSSGVTATGAKLLEGLAWKKPKPVRISRGATARRLMSLICTSRRTLAAACSGVAPIATSPRMTPNSPSKSMPSASSGRGTSSRGPRKSSEPPWYSSGMVSASGICGSLKARGLAARRVEGLHAGRAARVQLGVERLQRGLDRIPLLQGALQRRRNGAGRGGRPQVACHDHQPAVAAAVFQGGQLHAMSPLSCYAAHSSQPASSRKMECLDRTYRAARYQGKR
ncbi:unnamed protein product [Victoria cruziana]